MDELEKLFNVLSRDGYYTKSFEEFQAKYNDPAYRDKVFGVVTRDGLFTKTREEFDAKYAPSGVEAVEVDVQEEVPVKKKEDTVSPSGPSSLGLPSVTDDIQEKARNVEQQKVADFFDVSKPFAPKPKQMQEQMQMQENLVMVRQYDDFDIRGVNRGPMVQVNLNDPDLEKRKENQISHIL